jgi:hypothetical protein
LKAEDTNIIQEKTELDDQLDELDIEDEEVIEMEKD